MYKLIFIFFLCVGNLQSYSEEEIREYLKTEKKAKNLSQEKLGKNYNVSQSLVSNFLNNKNSPTLCKNVREKYPDRLPQISLPTSPTISLENNLFFNAKLQICDVQFNQQDNRFLPLNLDWSYWKYSEAKDQYKLVNGKSKHDIYELGKHEHFNKFIEYEKEQVSIFKLQESFASLSNLPKRGKRTSKSLMQPYPMIEGCSLDLGHGIDDKHNLTATNNYRNITPQHQKYNRHVRQNLVKSIQGKLGQQGVYDCGGAYREVPLYARQSYLIPHITKDENRKTLVPTGFLFFSYKDSEEKTYYFPNIFNYEELKKVGINYSEMREYFEVRLQNSIGRYENIPYLCPLIADDGGRYKSYFVSDLLKNMKGKTSYKISYKKTHENSLIPSETQKVFQEFVDEYYLKHICQIASFSQKIEFLRYGNKNQIEKASSS